jgi:FKBP-type peptidyl-prolyl cis-trans isomerase
MKEPLMKYALMLTVVAALMMSGPAMGADGDDAAKELKTLKEKFSYALGLDVGGNLKRMNMVVDIDALVRGLGHGLKGEKPLLTREQAMQAFQAMEEQRTAELKKPGTDFLAANKKKDGVVTTKSGLQYKVLEAGKGASPKATDRVRVHYKGTLLDGKEFDSSYKRGRPATFEVGRVIPGWSEALQLMKVGGKYKLFVPSALGYGAQGAGQMIGPHATLIFEVTLVKIEKPVDMPNMMPIIPKNN